MSSNFLARWKESHPSAETSLKNTWAFKKGLGEYPILQPQPTSHTYLNCDISLIIPFEWRSFWGQPMHLFGVWQFRLVVRDGVNFLTWRVDLGLLRSQRWSAFRMIWYDMIFLLGIGTTTKKLADFSQSISLIFNLQASIFGLEIGSKTS